MLTERISRVIERHGLLHSEDKVVVALSGGADSVALLHILVSLGYNCIAAHCNFHLRGDESDRDERYARDLARSLGCKLEVRHFDMEAERSGTGESMEMACRRVRYAWFETLLEDSGATAVAVAHHLDDNTETLFLKLLRRSGIKGLGGMCYRNGNVIRPLLEVRRADIERYLNELGIEWVTDHTNLENDFQRNRLRNVVLPVLRQNFTGADEAIAVSMAHIREASDFIEHRIGRLRGIYVSKGSVELKRLIEDEPDDCRFILYNLLGDVDMAVVDDILASADSSGRVFANRYLLNRGRLEMIEEVDDFFISGKLDDLPIRVTIVDREDFHPRRGDSSTLWLDGSVADDGKPFTLRRWKDGDRMHPYGMKGSKKLSDLFSDAGWSINDKRRAVVLEHDGKVLWVPGLRASRHYPVTADTKQILKIEYGN